MESEAWMKRDVFGTKPNGAEGFWNGTKRLQMMQERRDDTPGAHRTEMII